MLDITPTPLQRLVRERRRGYSLPAPFYTSPDVFAADDDMRESTGRFNASLQAGYFLLAVRALGLSAGPMGGFDSAAVDEEFFPGGRWRSILVVNIGHPGEDPWFDRLPRLGNQDVISWA